MQYFIIGWVLGQVFAALGIAATTYFVSRRSRQSDSAAVSGPQRSTEAGGRAKSSIEAAIAANAKTAEIIQQMRDILRSNGVSSDNSTDNSTSNEQ